MTHAGVGQRIALFGFASAEEDEYAKDRAQSDSIDNGRFSSFCTGVGE